MARLLAAASEHGRVVVTEGKVAVVVVGVDGYAGAVLLVGV